MNQDPRSAGTAGTGTIGWGRKKLAARLHAFGVDWVQQVTPPTWRALNGHSCRAQHPRMGMQVASEQN
jgi:hypothetical protein